MSPVVDLDAVMACADLVRRSGGREFEIGYLRDEDEPEFAAKGPGWYAQARYSNRSPSGAGLLVTDERRSPDEAADALSRRVLSGGSCYHCKLPVALADKDARACCRWRREGDRWARGCEA